MTAAERNVRPQPALHSDRAVDVEQRQPVSEVTVLGLGYVGFTLALSLAQAGLRVRGYDRASSLVEQIEGGVSPILEPGIREAWESLPAGALTVSHAVPASLSPVVIVCVGTPVDEQTRRPQLEQLEAALAAIVPRLTPETVVILRSTMPVGTTEGFVVPRLAQAVAVPHVAVCPERTIQGQALRELRALPQVIGATDPFAAEVAREVFEGRSGGIVEVSSPGAAEMVKLVCNAHTDLIYGFGNEVALIADAVGIDATEVIEAANFEYPRPDVCRPGYVGGSCLTKDPYLLLESARSGGYEPLLVSSARRLNEQLPLHVGERVLRGLAAGGCDPARATVVIAGIAYKGRPVTDDVRGSAAMPLACHLQDRVGELLGQDYVVASDRIAALGLTPTELVAGCERANALVLLVEHERYGELDVHALLSRMRPPRVVYDLWGVWRERLSGLELAYSYQSLGHGC